MNKLYFLLSFLLLLATSCFEDPEELVTNTNPFDSDYIYDFVSFEELVEVGEIPGTGGNVCFETISVKIVEETFHAIKRVNDVDLNNIYIMMDRGVLAGLFGTFDDSLIPFNDIQLNTPYRFKTNPWTYDCDDNQICVEFTVIYFIEDMNPPYDHVIETTKAQQVCFERIP